MPLYEYECSNCGHIFEKIEKVTAPHRQKCPRCRGRAERRLAAPAIQFKGSGWYVTDYAGRGAAPAETSAKDGEGGAKETKETKEAKESKEKKEHAPAKETGKKQHK